MNLHEKQWEALLQFKTGITNRDSQTADRWVSWLSIELSRRRSLVRLRPDHH